MELKLSSGAGLPLAILLLIVLNGCSQVSGQLGECSIVQASDLGDTSAPSSQPAIITDAAIAGDASGRPDVQLFGYRVVCLTVAATRDLYSYASVLAEFSCSGAVSALSQLECNDTGGTTNYTARFDVECSMSNTWQLAETTPGDNVFQPPHASFATQQRKDCSVCADPSESATLGNRDIDMETHCADCPIGCSGLGYCTTLNTCCNYYTNPALGKSMCLMGDCPSPQVPDESSTCDCPAFFTNLTDCDFCGLTCENGGTPEAVNCSMCFCPTRFMGTRCEEDVDECLNIPSSCENGASCVNTNGSFMCLCAAGYSGFNCSEDIDECTVDMPCQNGATCNNTFGSYMCVCAPGFAGFNCREDFDECTVTMPCQNGATCNNTFGSYVCICADGFMGFNCEEDIDECTVNMPCQNGATCNNTFGSYMCICADGFMGFDCEEDIDECTVDMPCQNGASCNNTIGSFICTCAAGYTGLMCKVLCESNFVLVSGQCEPSCDVKFCTHCTIPDKCDECEEGYALDAEECTTRTPSDSGEDNIVIFGIIAGVVLAILVLLATIVATIVTYYCRKKRPDQCKPKEDLMSHIGLARGNAVDNPLFIPPEDLEADDGYLLTNEATEGET